MSSERGDSSAHNDNERPSYIDAADDPDPPAPDIALPDLRQSIQGGERARSGALEIPSWAPYVFAGVVFVALMILGIAAVLHATRREELPPPPPKPKVEDIGGVPVRDDLNAPGL